MNRFKSVLSGVYFVLYTGSVISFEYVKYKAKTCICWLTCSTTSFDANPYTTMIKNIAIQLSKKNIYYIKIFQALAYSSEIYDNDLASFFIQYTDAVQYEANEFSGEYIDKVVKFAEKKGIVLPFKMIMMFTLLVRLGQCL